MILSDRRKNTIIRDSLHGLTEVDPHLRSLLDTPELQRLRWIHQTGLTFLVFFGAEHSRFTHSLGSYHVASRVFAHLTSLARTFDLPLSLADLNDDLRRAFVTATLCHDLGHTAFSHVFEPMLLPDTLTSHEDCTIALLDPKSGTKIAQAIDDWCDRTEVVALLQGNHLDTCLSQLVTGISDVDRWDYLLRDARATGVRYGTYDLDWLIHTMLITLNEDARPVLLFDGRRGPVAFQQFLLARRYMYQQVYFHATVRAAEALLRAIFERSFVLDWKDSNQRALVPAPLQGRILGGQPPSLSDFLAVDDVLILNTLRRWAESKLSEPVLRYLCERFISRQLPKQVALPPEISTGRQPIPEATLEKARTCVLSFLRTEPATRDCPNLEDAIDYFVLINRSNYAPSDLENVWFEVGGTAVPANAVPVSASDPPVADLAFSNVRLYVPGEVRDQLQQELAKGVQ